MSGIVKKILMGFGALFIVFIILAVLFGGSEDSSTTNIAQTQDNTEGKITAEEPAEAKYPEGSIYNYLTFENSATTQIGPYYTAPSGYVYLILDLHLDNTGTRTYNTNPFFWNLKADGITYNTDTATFSEQIDTQSVEVGPGGSYDWKIVFLVPSTTTNFEVIYNGF